MRTLRIDLEYDGTNFRGFAPQPGLRTVGGELEAALGRVLGEPIRVTSAARTDSGVHARGQVVSLLADSGVVLADLKKALNALIGPDMLVRDVCDAPAGFDARRSARTRRYGYAIWNGPERNVWERRWTVHIDEPLDMEAMHDACQALVGRHDFGAFRTHQAQDDPGKGTIRRVHGAGWRRDEADPRILRFEIEADAFLRHMVRTIVGSSILVGLGKAPRTAFTAMLAGGERAAAGPTAPASGLALLEVTY